MEAVPLTRRRRFSGKSTWIARLKSTPYAEGSHCIGENERLISIFSRIDIFPSESGLKLNAVYENGDIYRPDVLDIDMDRFMGQLRTASFTALTLSEAGWANTHTIRPLLAKAYRSAYTLAMEKKIYTKETTPQLLAKAHATLLSVSSQVKPVGKEGEKTPT